jgi:hypothetical protein
MQAFALVFLAAFLFTLHSTAFNPAVVSRTKAHPFRQIGQPDFCVFMACTFHTGKIKTPTLTESRFS